MLEINRYMRTPLYVDAVEVTKENMHEVAEWCGGVIEKGEQGTFIRVPVVEPKEARQTKAWTGCFVLKSNIGLKVYTRNAFRKAFLPSETGEDCGKTDPRGKICKRRRGHITACRGY